MVLEDMFELHYILVAEGFVDLNLSYKLNKIDGYFLLGPGAVE